mmetsp:Transcript_29364/g.44318  ORF Transcript_29364/g.44318 Transcript_29364/m.44318 type:complete len:127 (-) Transcript_29364:24-404(-)
MAAQQYQQQAYPPEYYQQQEAPQDSHPPQNETAGVPAENGHVTQEIVVVENDAPSNSEPKSPVAIQPSQSGSPSVEEVTPVREEEPQVEPVAEPKSESKKPVVQQTTRPPVPKVEKEDLDFDEMDD